MNFTPFFRPFFLRIFLAIALSLVGFTAAADLRPGKEYELLSPPQAVETGKKIEVLEIFSYACSHCFDLEADISKWAKQLPNDVEFRRLPAIFRADWTPLAKVFYTFEAMGLTERLNGEFFNAIHVRHTRFADDNAIFDWVEKQGIPRKSFIDNYSSFSTQSKTLRAKQLTQAYGISGVPTVIVDGKYRTSVSNTGSHAGLMSALDQLIKRARQERAGN
ncbi:thiol:disulfide interchange protein DsbA [Sulfuricella denitrificans skB26]|uniref:Thiol:disulfide interchange protein n=1 Tax=Sulfuricella denitrificans (strain DSM 22764 / NBRC 105220 / skB26) TaxID=1163617 RepID=S6B913_SULDS|nr:thiol:disulfide interchange protein DsbA/DsbL [Sulfuricella denitrificans]BAN36812.1 thiol:disulfide interchange protein DsbA [Sulfuricella denitrificans skB26]